MRAIDEIASWANADTAGASDADIGGCLRTILNALVRAGSLTRTLSRRGVDARGG